MATDTDTTTTPSGFVRTVSTGVLHAGDSFGAFCSSTRRAVAVPTAEALATPVERTCERCFGTDGEGPARRAALVAENPDLYA